MANVRKETVSGIKWQLLQKLTMEPLQLVYAMLLARLLTPADMGILGLTAIFFAVAATLSEAGFGSALIRKQDRTDTDINTVFWFNLAVSAVLGIGLGLASPWFASFYHQPELLWLTRCSAALLFLNSLTSVHVTLFSCRRDFKTPAIIQFLTAVCGMPVCLFTAWLGWGVWALMAQQVTVGVLNMLAFWYTSPWKPRFVFSISSFRELFAFSSRLALSGLLDTFYRNLRTFIIGKFYSAATLGYYTRGGHLAEMVPSTLYRALNNVSFPVLATLQDDEERLRAAYRKYIRVSTLCMAWVAMCSCAMAEPLVAVVYGSQWGDCVPFVRIVGLLWSMTHINGINMNLLKVKGRSDIMLNLEVVKKTISVAMMLYAATISPLAICWAAFIYTQIALMLNCTFSGRYIGLNWFRQMLDYLPYVALSALAWLPGYVISLTSLPVMVQLVLGGSCAFVLYVACLQLMRDSAYGELLLTASNAKALQRFPRVRRVIGYLQHKLG